MLELRPMTPADLPAALALWSGMEGLSLFPSDSVEGLARYLGRNPGLSVTGWLDGQLVGAALAGHDGRRGWLHHVAVAPGCRLRGIGKAMVEWCLAALTAEGIGRVHILVNADNEPGKEFWRRIGWGERPMVHLMSFTTDPDRA